LAQAVVVSSEMFMTDLKNIRLMHLALALRGWVLPLLLLAIWWCAVAFQWTTSPILVSPVAVWQRGFEQVLSGELRVALLASLHRGHTVF
jgi:ABC-type nitrate/sulfonate/bicarbonate transport system permease component